MRSETNRRKRVRWGAIGAALMVLVPGAASVLAERPATADVNEEARLRFAYTLAAPGGFDPIRSTGAFANLSMFPVYDRLVHLNPDGSPKPGLAESWEWSDDGLALTLHLRDGVTFHDGETLDAEAVRANLERSKDHPESSLAPFLTPIESVEAVDELTVVINLNEPMASLPLELAERAGMMLSPAAFDNDDLAIQPVGAGAYRLTRYDPDASITFDRFEDYWDPDSVHFAGIDFTVQVDAVSRLNALLADETDITYINATDVQTAESAGMTVISEPMLSFQAITLNRSIEPFDNPDVRKAMNVAIDRQGIINAINNGVGAASIQMFPEGYFAWNPEYPVDAFAYDPDAAKALLADAGYPDGFEFTLTVMNVPYVEAYAVAVQAQWAEIGIDANIELISPAAGADLCWLQHDCEAFTIRASATDPVTSFQMLYTADGPRNIGQDSSPELDAMIADIQAAADPDERAALLQQASAYTVENALDVIVYHDASPLAFNERMTGVEYYRTGWIEFAGMGITD